MALVAAGEPRFRARDAEEAVTDPVPPAGMPPPAPPGPPEAAPSLGLDLDALERDCNLQFFVAGGPGGQHRNKTASAVRLTHRPTGIVIVASERRSQHQNRAEALERLRERLVRLSQKPKPRKKTRPTKASRKRRLEGKRQRATRKATRRRPDAD
jgi:ribosome-associated protein